MLKMTKTKLKRIIFITGLLTLFVLIIPLIINILFKNDLGIEMLRSEWTAGEALSFYGAVLGGLITLGGVWLTIKDERKKQKTENAIAYKPIIELVKCNKPLNSGELIKKIFVTFCISVDNDSKKDYNYFLKQQHEETTFTRLIFKNKGRGETFNLTFDGLEMNSNWDQDNSPLQCDVSGLYIGEILKDNEFAIDISFPDYIFLPKKNYKDKDFIIQCTLKISYSDMFDMKRYQLITYFNMHIEKADGIEKKSPLQPNSKLGYYRVFWSPKDFGPERRIYSEKQKKFIHEYEYIKEQL